MVDRATPEKVTLELTLTAIPPDDDEEMLFPLARGSIMARATFTDNRVGTITSRMRSRIT